MERCFNPHHSNRRPYRRALRRKHFPRRKAVPPPPSPPPLPPLQPWTVQVKCQTSFRWQLPHRVLLSSEPHFIRRNDHSRPRVRKTIPPFIVRVSSRDYHSVNGNAKN